MYAEPATNLPLDGEIKWWLQPMLENAEWLQDATGPHGAGYRQEDLSFPLPELHNLPSEFEEFFEGYLACALWLLPEEDQAGFSEITIEQINASALESMREECWDFWTANLRTLMSTRDDYDFENAGHDFFLTRNGHGAGFWDRGLGKAGDLLTEAAEAYGESSLYAGDDRGLYVS